MNKMTENAPCPCGSGIEYKKCCIDKISASPNLDGLDGKELKTPKQLLELVKAEFANREVGSLEEMNQQLSTMINRFNSAPKAPFLGLSPAQMHSLLNMPFDFHNDVFIFECKDVNKLKEVPLLRHSLYLLNKLKDEGAIKATQTGNLPRAFVREMYHAFFSNERYARLPNTEDDLLAVTRVKHLLEISGLMKKRSNKFSLTKKGEGLLLEDSGPKIFNEIAPIFMSQWNWAFGDRYSDLVQIQRSAIFNIYLLHKKCHDWILDKDLGRIYLNAFPALVNEARGPFSPEDEVINCFCTRFLNRVCLPLGLLEVKEDVAKSIFDRKEYYRVTPFFRESFKFWIQ